MQSAQSKEALEKQIGEVYKAISTFERELGFTSDPLERNQKNFKIQNLRFQVQKLEEERNQLKIQESSLESLGAKEPDLLKIFISHARGDEEKARELYFRLRSRGYSVWLEDEDLLPGQDWRLAISKAVKSSDIILICLSQKSTLNTGFHQRELKIVLDTVVELPEGRIFIIPLRLEECEMPDPLKKIAPADLYKKAGYDILFKALEFRAKSLNRV
jgi:TIR domain